MLDVDAALEASGATDEPNAKTIAFHPKIALCLSGGGYRAALFHLGGVRRLNELGLLADLEAISSVSGGSILSGFLATRIADWRPASGQLVGDNGAWEDQIAVPFRALTSTNIRTGPIVKRVLYPWNWFRPETAGLALRDKYLELLGDSTLHQMPAEPRFIFSATDLVFGVNWIFTRELAGDYLAGYQDTNAHLWVADAVAASSCFPPVFDPIPLRSLRIDPATLKRGKARRDQKGLVKHVVLNDGGNYDNLGLEPVWKDLDRGDGAETILLVSDGGGTFDYQSVGRRFWQRWQRYAGVQGEQGSRARKRWLIERSKLGHVRAAYWGIGSGVERYVSSSFVPRGGYQKPLAERWIAKIRTDLDAFSPDEAKILENHGYCLADAAIQRHLPDLAPRADAPFRIPHPDLMPVGIVESRLAKSSKRRLFGRR